MQTMLNPCGIEPTVVLLGAWQPYTLAIARRCFSNNIKAYMLAIERDVNPWKCPSSCLAGGAIIDPAIIGTPAGVLAIRDYVELVQANALIARLDVQTGDQMAWIAQNRSAIGPKCKLLAPPDDVVMFFESKCNQIRAALEAGFGVLPTWYISGLADCSRVSVESYPIVLRPDRPWLVEPRFRVELIYTPEDLRNYLTGLKFIGAPLIAQPFKNMRNLIVHGVRSETGDWMQLECFLSARKFKGYSFSLERVGFPPGVEDACQKFAEITNLVGGFHYDFLYSSEHNLTYFLETNVRFGGSTDKVTRLGFDEPLLTLAAYGYRVRSKIKRLKRVTNKRAALGILFEAFRGHLTEFDYPNAFSKSIYKSCIELLCFKDSLFDWNDLRGTLNCYMRNKSV